MGEKLKKLRSDKRTSLNEVSRATRIKVEYLECLEEGYYDKLPVDVYVRGFLKSYGEYLGVDENILIKLYEKEKGIKRNLAKGKGQDEVKKIKPLNISAFVFTPKKAAVFSVAILVLSAFIYLYRQAGSLTDVPRLIILNPGQNTEVNSDSLFLEGKTDKNAAVFVNNQRMLVDDDGKFGENIYLQSGINVISIKAVNRFQKEAQEDITVKANFQDENVAGASTVSNDALFDQKDAASTDQAMQMDLKVDPGPVWVSVESDGNVVYSGTILSGASQSFTAREKISVSSGRASATYVKLNGKDWAALGKDDGAVKGVVFDKNSTNLNN